MASYDYNEIQPGASDIDREAWPVMYDPYGDQDGLTEVSTQDTETVDLNGKGTSNSKLSADVKISKQSGNILRKTTDGLFVSVGEDPVLSIDGSQFIGVTGEPQRPTITLKKSENESNDLKDENGLYVHIPIKEVWGSDSISVDMDGDEREISVVLSPESDNIIQDTPNGLYAAPTASTEIDSSNSITATKNENVYTLSINTDNTGNVQFDITENGLKANVDFPLDTLTGTNPIKVTTEKVGEQDEHVVSLDIASGADNLLDVAPDGLRAVLSTGSDQDHNVRFTGTGTPTSPLKANVDIPEDFIRGVGETSSLALSVDQETGELTGDVKIDTTNPGNVTLSFTQDGMVASADIPEDYINNVVDTDTVALSVDNGDLSATAKVSSKGDNQTDPANALEIEQDGLWTPTLYLGPFDSTARPSDAITGQYIFDTDLGYCLYRNGGAWVNSTGAIIEGNVEPSGSAVDWLVNPMTSYGDLIVGGPSGVPQNLIPGIDGQVLTIASGVPSWLNIPAQNGDHKALVDSNDLNPDYLVNKFTAGDNITIVNNGSSLEFSAPSAPNDIHVDYNAPVTWATDKQTMTETQTFIYRTLATGNIVPTAILIPCDHQYANTTYKAFISLTESYTTANVLYSGSVTVTNPPSTPPRTARIPLTPQNGTTHIPVNTLYSVCFGKSSGSLTECFKVVFSGTIINCRTYAGAITETPNFQWNAASTQNWTPCVGVEYKMYRS